MSAELFNTPLWYHARTIFSLRLRRSPISAACANCVASIAFILSPNAIRAVLSAVSGMGLSLIAVKEESVEGKEEAAARTMDWIASMGSCDGGSDGSDV